MSAAERLTLLDADDAAQLCERATDTLNELVEVLNEEITLLRAGRISEATELSARKGQLAQDYAQLARSVQQEAERIKQAAPDALSHLSQQHQRLATQIAENLRVLATARSVTQELIGEVAKSLDADLAPPTYSERGELTDNARRHNRGFSVNRSS